MQRHSLIVLALGLACLSADRAVAQPWVAKMISTAEHDFGTVARGSDTVYRFPVKNIYKQDIELVRVRTSCGCTTPSLENKLLKTGDVGYVVASFNTRTFTGVHGATLTVTAAWNDNGVRRTGETQLRVSGNIRSDVVFEPGAVKFENVDQGAVNEQKVQVSYAGGGNWKILDVRGQSDDLEVELSPTRTSSGRVSYELLVRLKDSAPAGYLNEQLVLVTSDQRNPRIPIHVSGRVMPAISVAPTPLIFGDVPRGEQVVKRVVVRGKKPFRILAVQSDEKSFQFKTDDQASDRHVVEIVFHPGREVGQVKRTIHIATDLGESYRPSLTAYATVLADESDDPRP